MIGTITFAQFVSEEHRRAPGATGELSALLHDISIAVRGISAALGRGAAAGLHGDAGAVNAQGERQQKLDVLANDIVLRACARGGGLAGVVSEELDDVHRVPDPHRRGKYLLAVDPLDGSSNIDVDMPVGTIFSVLRRPGGAGDAGADDFLQPGAQQVCAGYAIYGPSTMLVISVGRGVHGFTLDRELGDFVLTHRDLRIPETTREFAINAANDRFWEPPVKRYVEECVAGRAGPRQVDFNMRWVATLVADVHRILVRGGVFLYPSDYREPKRPGRLRLLYEAAPMAFLVEQAGGAASTGRLRLLDVRPRALHDRAPVILGSRAEVERLVRYHDEHARGIDRPYRNPLFGSRSLLSEP